MRVQISHGQLVGYHATSWSEIISVGVLAKLQLYSPLLLEHFSLLMIQNLHVASLLVAEKQQSFILRPVAHQELLKCSVCISHAFMHT